MTSALAAARRYCARADSNFGDSTQIEVQCQSLDCSPDETRN